MDNTFRTTFNISEFPYKLNYKSKSLFIGSCFTENIGNYLKELKFDVKINPFGIIYNPVSISKNIDYLINKKQFGVDELVFYNELWFSFHHHGKFSDPDQIKCLIKINTAINEFSEFLKQADFVFLTLGSAYTYTHKSTNQVVANCHKFPSDTFVKTLLEPQKIVDDYKNILANLFSFNNKLKVVFTVSPIRHWKDGATENQLSKSVLFVAIHEIIKKTNNCFYFPAYELIMDDLRDYRFYEDDMIHPNITALEYIRNKFTDAIIDEQSQSILNEIKKLIQAAKHKPFYPNSQSYKQFKEKFMEQTKKLRKQYPFLSLNEFEKYFK